MSSWKMSVDRLLAALRQASPTDAVGAAGAVVGLVLVASGIGLQEMGVGAGATIRTLGGVLLLGGLGTVLFAEARRRDAVVRAARRIADRYAASTAGWRWPNRYGLAGVLIGLALLPPAIVMQAIFGDPFGVMVISPGLVAFWGGVVLIVYGMFTRRRDGAGTPPDGRVRGRDDRR